MKVAILGGGIAGLSFRAFCKKETVLFEKSSSLGGMCKSQQKEGFTFDVVGSHVIFSNDEEVLNFEKEVLGDNITFHERNTKIYWKGKLIGYPFENDLASLGKEEAFDCLHDYIRNVVKEKIEGTHELKNFEEFIINKFGKRIAEDYLLPYNRKIWKTEPSQMSCDWIKGRVPQPPAMDVVESAMGIKTEGYSANARFWYPLNGGFQSITDAIAKKEGGEIKKEFEIKHVNKIGEKFRISNGIVDFDFDKVISSLPVPTLINMIDNVPENVKSAANSLAYNSVISIMIGLNGDYNKDFSWMYVPFEEDGLFNRVSFPSNFSPHNTPEECSSILAEITCKFEDDIWNMNEEELIEKVIYDLERMNLLKKEDVIFKDISKEKYGYIIYDLTFQEKLNKITQFLESYGIESVGRFGSWQYWNSDKCIRSAMDKAREINGK